MRRSAKAFFPQTDKEPFSTLSKIEFETKSSKGSHDLLLGNIDTGGSFEL